MPMTCRDRESGTNKGSASEFISSAPSPFCEIVAAHDAEGDALCRISPVILDAMRSEGLFRTLQPRRFGGGEADIAAFLDKQIEISATDRPTGWLAGWMGVLAFHPAPFHPKATTAARSAQQSTLRA